MPGIIADRVLLRYYLFFTAFLVSGLLSVLLINDDLMKLVFVIVSATVTIAFMIHSFEWVYFLFILSIPLSVNIDQVWGNTRLSLPVDGFIILTGSYFGLQLILHSKQILSTNYKIAGIVTLFITCLLISSAFSNLPVVAFKATLTQTAYIFIFLIMPLHLFNRQRNIKRFLLGYITTFSGVIIYTIIRHHEVDFDINATAGLVQPFYNDHAQYGACLAMIIPVLAALCYQPGLLGLPNSYRSLFIPLLVLFLAAIYLSHSRAAWISIISAAVLFITILLHFRWYHYLGILLTLSFLALLNLSSIQNYLAKNKTDSNKSKSTSADEIKSISNVSSDISNLERINRWHCAITMFKKKPWLGFGTGTYQFNYISFQSSNDLTPISVHSPGANKPGRGGDTHHEYLKLLSESGIFSLLTFTALLLFVLHRGYQIIYDEKKKNIRWLITGAVCGLFSFIVHGFFNSFLDTDKVAVIFWGMIAIILSSYSTSEKKENDQTSIVIKNTETGILLK